MHSRGPTEQYFYVWEPHCGCLHKVKKVQWYPLIKEGQRSHNIGKWSRTPIYYTTRELSTVGLGESLNRSRAHASCFKIGR